MTAESLAPANLRAGVFGAAADGDGRSNEIARLAFSSRFGAPTPWAWVHQVHGADVIEATSPGLVGEADALFTRLPGLTVTIGTADCVPVILEGDGVVGIAHAGWRGTRAGVIEALRLQMEAVGAPPTAAALGPSIGPCCFEVGGEVLEAFGGHTATTTWGTPSVDLRAVLADSLSGLDVSVIDACTRTDERFNSYRRDGTPSRQVTLAWLPD